MISPSFCAALPSASAFASSASFAASLSFSSSSASLTAASILAFSSAPTLSPYSRDRLLHAVHQRVERVARLHRPRAACGRPRRAPRRPSPSSGSRLRTSPEFALIVILFSLPVALSFADTCRMPLASMSNVTSICGMPRGDGGMPSRLNWPEALVARRDVALALQHVDRHRALVVVGRREHLLRLGRDRRVLLDELGHHAAQRLDAERQRRHVEQQHVLDVALQHAALDRRADRNRLVRDSRPCAAPCRRTP